MASLTLKNTALIIGSMLGGGMIRKRCTPGSRRPPPRTGGANRYSSP
jgi:hypothetical protein